MLAATAPIIIIHSLIYTTNEGLCMYACLYDCIGWAKLQLVHLTQEECHRNVFEVLAVQEQKSPLVVKKSS